MGETLGLATEASVLELKTFPVGEHQSNCYLLIAPGGQEGVLIDPGDQADDIVRLVGSLTMTHILITHGHPDHVGALEAVRHALKVPVGIHHADAETYNLPFDISLEDSVSFDIGDDRLEVVHIPGHTPGSIALRLMEVGQSKRAIVGDTIFPGGPGHTQTPQDLETSLASLAKTIFTWADETTLYPGHGGSTTVGEERAAFEAFYASSRPSDLCGDVTW
jgi:hydroxyacylglutathione hydrolase